MTGVQTCALPIFAVTETDKKELSARADALMVELVKRVAAEVRAMREAEQSGRKPSKGVA